MKKARKWLSLLLALVLVLGVLPELRAAAADTKIESFSVKYNPETYSIDYSFVVVGEYNGYEITLDAQNVKDSKGNPIHCTSYRHLVKETGADGKTYVHNIIEECEGLPDDTYDVTLKVGRWDEKRKVQYTDEWKSTVTYRKRKAEDIPEFKSLSARLGEEPNTIVVRCGRVRGATCFTIKLEGKETGRLAYFSRWDDGESSQSGEDFVERVIGKDDVLPSDTYIITVWANCEKRDRDAVWKSNKLQTTIKVERIVEGTTKLTGVSFPVYGMDRFRSRPGSQLLNIPYVRPKFSPTEINYGHSTSALYYDRECRLDPLLEEPKAGETCYSSVSVWSRDTTFDLEVDPSDFTFYAKVEGFDVTFDHVEDLGYSDFAIRFKVTKPAKNTAVLSGVKTSVGFVEQDGGKYYPNFESYEPVYSSSRVASIYNYSSLRLDRDCKTYLTTEPQPETDYYFYFEFIPQDKDNYIDISQVTAEKCSVLIKDYKVTFDRAEKGRVYFKARLDLPQLAGTVNLDAMQPHPGSVVRCQLTGDVSEIRSSGGKLIPQWQLSPDGKTNWTDVEGDTDSAGVPVYPCGVSDVGKYLRVKLSAEGYMGYLLSTPRQVVKSRCYAAAVTPNLTLKDDQVYVENAKSSQEYLIVTSRRNIDGLTESDWAAAKAPSADGLFNLGGTTGRTYYVYTRMRETDSMNAGTDVRYALIYNGEAVSLQDLTLTVIGVDPSTGANYALEAVNGNTYYCRVNDVIKVTANPIPAGATNYEGVYYDNWFSNSLAGSFYTDRSCTKQLQSGQYYKTVYFKPTEQRNNVDIVAQFTKGYNDVIHTNAFLHVGDSSGNCLLRSASTGRVTVKAGETALNVPVTTDPEKASLQGVTLSLYNGTGTPPGITVHPEDNTVDIDAGKASLGTFTFNIYQNGKQVIGSVIVDVVTAPVEEIRLFPQTLSAEAGAQYTLVPQLYPSDASGTVLWWSTNSSVGTVSNGVLTISNAAQIGATTTVTAKVNGLQAECDVTVVGEQYDLKVCGTQVTGKNKEDILGNGVFSFSVIDETPVLIIHGSCAASGRIIENHGVEGLVILVNQDVTLKTENQTEPFRLTADTTITGPGKLTLAGADSGVFMPSAFTTLTLRDIDIEVEDDCNWGIVGAWGANGTKLVIDHANLSVNTVYGAICDFGGGITLENCEIVSPYDGRLSDDGRSIVDWPGEVCKRVQIRMAENAAGQKQYGLEIAGMPVTEANRGDILGNGLFSFDGDRTLTVNGSYSANQYVINNEGVEGLIISIAEDAVLWSSENRPVIRLEKDTTITGPGALTLTGSGEGIYMASEFGTLTLKNISVTAKCPWGIAGPNGGNNAGLLLDNAGINAACSDAAIFDFGGGITMKDCAIVNPEDGKISDDGTAVVNADGSIAQTVIIEATGIVAPPEEPFRFDDVKNEEAFYFAPVYWAYGHEPQITTGTSATMFSPRMDCTRAQVVTFLWRAAGEPAPAGGETPFTDVAPGQYYTTAVAWAVEQGITKGTSATTFTPNRTCSRAEIVTFLWRANGEPAAADPANPFTDVPTGQFYTDAVLWAVEKGVTNGTSPTTFSPTKVCSRSEIVTFLYRAMK